MIKFSTLIIIAFSTIFFPRILTYFGAPDPINFIHFLSIPVLFLIALASAQVKKIKHINAVNELMLGLFLFLCCMTISSLLNGAGFINLVIQFLIFTEPYLFLLVFLLSPMDKNTVNKCSIWLMRFCFANLSLAILQSFLIPIGLYPTRGGTIQDSITGVFGGGGGSAANYISATISIFATLYFLLVYKRCPIWLRLSLFIVSLYQTQVSDSKQVFLAIGISGLIIFALKIKKPKKFLRYVVILLPVLFALTWVYTNLDFEFFSAYKNWTSREGIFELDGEGIRTKLAAFPIIRSYHLSPLNWLFGIGPGHSVSRLGGWMLDKYSSLLVPLGATIHPASSEVFNVVSDGWIARQSTIFFPLFTWAGIWGDFGLIGLGIYIYLGVIVFQRICKSDISKFYLISTVIFGFILTQMEEPAHTLTVAYLIALQSSEESET